MHCALLPSAGLASAVLTAARASSKVLRMRFGEVGPWDESRLVDVHLVIKPI